MFDICVIMAGGSGTRLWPASSSRLPKQFLSMGEKEGGSFFHAAVTRALAVSSRVVVIAGKSHIPHIVADCSKLKAAEKKRIVVIAEPVAKNTAPAIACAVVYALLSGQSSVLVLTSDHIISPLEKFKADAALAASCAAEGKLVVFGIKPSRPETGYGYIEIAKPVKRRGGEKPSSGHIAGEAAGAFSVTAFREKPDYKTACKFAASDRFFWNSGMFAFTAEFMDSEFSRLAQDVMLPFKKLKIPQESSYNKIHSIRVLETWPGLDSAYKKAKAISFDYAIAEKCSQTVMVRVNFDWIDVGNWEEYAKICGASKSEVYSADENSCHVDSDIPVALAGVEDLIVVIRSGKNGAPAAALITRKGQTQKVRDIVEKIKKAGRGELL